MTSTTTDGHELHRVNLARSIEVAKLKHALRTLLGVWNGDLSYAEQAVYEAEARALATRTLTEAETWESTK